MEDIIVQEPSCQQTEPNKCLDPKCGLSSCFHRDPRTWAIPRQPGSAYGTAQPPPHYGSTQPIVLISSSEHLQHFLQCSAFLSHSLNPLQKQMEHANQQTGFSDSSSLHPMHSQALHPAPSLLASPQLSVQMQPAGKPGFATTSQSGSRLPFIQHSQNPQFYHK
jgi:G protein pathway suppressor 2